MANQVQPRLNEFVAQWMSDLSRDSLDKLLKDTENYINTLTELLTNEKQLTQEDKNYAHVGAVFVRGLYDYIQIRTVLADKNWIKDTNLLDYVWVKFWDCKERFEYAKQIVGGDFVEHLSILLDDIAAFYETNFGPGTYLSPDILIRREECSICGNDFRACSHISGRLYGGDLCCAIAKDFTARSVSIVNHPKDPRCRLWPWNYDRTNHTFKGAVMTSFRLDDFLFDKDWALVRQPHHAGFVVGQEDINNQKSLTTGEQRVRQAD